MVPSDRDDHGKQARLRRQETPTTTAEAPEREAREIDAAQQTFGNAALVELLGAPADPGGMDAAIRALRVARRASGPVRPEHGGDPDPVVDGPLTAYDLRPRAFRRRDARREDGPDDPSDEAEPGALPPEDVEGWPDPDAESPPTPPGSPTSEARAQPSTRALVEGLGLWLTSLDRWLPSPTLRLLAHALAAPAPCLHDPDGRPVLARARAAAGAVALACEAGAPVDLVRCLAELAAARPLVDDFERLAACTDELPSAEAMLRPHLPSVPAPAGRAAHAPCPALRHALDELVGAGSASVLVPTLELPPDPDEDGDPLGLDRYLDDRRDPPTPEHVHRTACLEAAERLASRVSVLCARFAGAAAALLSALPPGTHPYGGLLDAMRRFDEESRQILHLLLDVADAARGDEVPAKGLRNGVRRAARAVDALRDRTLDDLARVPLDDAVPPPRAPDPLDAALRHGDPGAARPWLRQLPAPEGELALALVDALAPAPPEDVLLGLGTALAHEGRPRVRTAVEQLVGGCLLWLGRTDEALALARSHLERARERHDGALAAAATLLAMEARRLEADPEGLRAARDEGVRLLRRLDAPALTLLARWRPPAPAEG